MTLNPVIEGFVNDYDLVIIANGIWELAQKEACERLLSDNNSTALERLEVTLDRIHRNTPTELQVMFRTSAFDTRHVGKDQMIWDTIALSKNFFHKKAKAMYERSGTFSNVGLVDWGSVMAHRSFGEDRIEGDHPAHYGLEARTLYIQQLMHELVKADF